MMEPDQEYLLGLGKLSANHQVLEAGLSLICWSLIGPDQKIGQIVTAQVGFSNILDLASALGRYRLSDNPELIERLESLLARAGQAEAARNQMMHSIWAQAEDSDGQISRIKLTARRKQGLRHQLDRNAIVALRDAVNLFLPLISEAIDYVRALADAGITVFTTELIEPDT